MKAKIVALPIAVLSLGLVVSCGGGGEPDPLSKKAFVVQANAICAQATADREAAMSEAVKDSESEGETEEGVTDAAVSSTDDMVSELDDLGVPKGDKKQVEVIVRAFEQGVETIEADPEKGLGSIAFKVADEAALSYGLVKCVI